MASKSAAIFGGLLGICSILGAGLSFAQQPADPAPLETVGAPSLEAYRDSLRRLFVLREYEKLLTLADEIERNYPAEQTVAYYRNESNRRIEEKKRESARPYKSMRDRGVVLETPPPTPVPITTPIPLPGVTPGATPAAAAPDADAPDAAAPAAATSAAAAAAPPPPPPAPAAGSDSLQDLMPWIGGAAAALLALIALVLFARRRASAAEEPAPAAAKPGLRSFPASAGAVSRAPLGGKPFEDAGETSFGALEPLDDVRAERDLFAESTGGFSAPITTEEPEPPKPPRRPEPAREPEPGPISISSSSISAAPEPAADQRTEFPSLPDATEAESNPFDLKPAAKTESRPPWESKSSTDTDIPTIADEPSPEPSTETAAAPSSAGPPPPPDDLISPERLGVSAAVFGLPPAPGESTSVAEGDLAGLDSPEQAETDGGLETATAPAERSGLTIADRDTLFELPDDHDVASKTQTSWNLAGADAPPPAAPSPAAEQVKIFHRDETIQLVPGDLGEGGDSQITEPPSPSPMVDTKASPEFGGPSDTGSADPFEKEKYHGMLAFKEARWDQAVHHLSVAAALRPEAGDVKDFLRRARKMRKSPEGA